MSETMIIGQLAPRDQYFCPLSALAKYPYKYLRGADSDRVSTAYFAEGKLQARGWTLFYIHTLLPSSPKPLIFVPAAEVEAFFSDINENLKTSATFPNFRKEPGFVVSFLQTRSPRPRYLGRLTSKDALPALEDKIPGPEFEQEREERLDDRTLDAFKVKMELAVQAGKNKSKAGKKKTAKVNGKGYMEGGLSRTTKGSRDAQLERTRLYLGLDEIANDPSWRGSDFENCTLKAFSRNVVFISVDVESYERSHSTITEIGISTLDTNDLIDLAPGKGGTEWMKKMRPRHFRIKEASHLENHEFVRGCAERFEQRFGISEWISIKEAPQVVASCFKHPFSAPARPDDSINIAADDPLSKRNIVLLGHDVQADITYLRRIGYDLTNLDNLLEAVDTADLFRALNDETQMAKLGHVISTLGITPWNLHNAGNDAAYTLEAMIGICFKSLGKGEVEET